jgi:O-antigen/teichoic acid export membrane protein
MAEQRSNNLVLATLWGIFSKMIDAAAKFVTIPILVGYYGKGDYGLIALAFSLNAYLRLMDMGLNIGSIRFFSMWITNKEWEKIQKVSQSSIVFYGVIGLVNALIFILMSVYAGDFFNVTPSQLPVFKWMLYVLAGSAVFNWTSNVVTQLLTANDQITWVNKVTIISSLLNFCSALMAIYFKLSLNFYFFLYILSTLIVIPLNIYKLKVYNLPLASLISPRWDGPAFKEIMGYSVAIFAMGVFQFSADNLRPLLLGIYSVKGIEVLTDYRVLQTIAMLVIAFGGVFTQVLLPSASKIYAENNQEKINVMVFDGTKYITVFLAFIVFALVINAKALLVLYMGTSYAEISMWLQLWLITVLFAMHNSPVASLVLASGKTRFLVYSAGISCLLTLPVTIFFASSLGVGAAVIGYFVYVLLQIGGYYFYYIPYVLKLNSSKLFFNSFAPSLVIGTVGWGITYGIGLFVSGVSGWISLFLNTAVFSIIFGLLTLTFVVRLKELKSLKKKFLNK